MAVATHLSPVRPSLTDGASMWRLTEQTQGIDLNSPYHYLLWCRDFAETTRVIHNPEGDVVAFTTAYVRPDEPTTLMIWQQVVSTDYRGRNLGHTMVRELTRNLLEQQAITHVEATVTDTTGAPVRTLQKIADEFGGTLSVETLFDQTLFPEGNHEAESLVRIGPLNLTGESS